MKPKYVHYYYLKVLGGKFEVKVRKDYQAVVIDKIAVADNEDEAKRLVDTLNKHKQDEKLSDI
jgi:hypothetical protein